MWQYDRIEIKHGNIRELIDKLNELGNDNWEIIYYNETKPPKFGDDWITIIIVKRLKPA
jgi:hypothetical protein